MSMMMAMTMIRARAAPCWAVNVEVWVRKPGPMAEVAIRKAAPKSTERLGFAAGWFRVLGSLLIMYLP